MRARYYSTELMRFINQDIVVGDISNSSSLNRYTYVEGNPATLIDPFGLDPSRFENGAKGTYNVLKGGTMMGFGALTMKLGGLVAAAGGPPGWILGGGLIVVGGIITIFGYFDANEGCQQIANAVCDTNYQTTHFVRDNVFGGDQVAYESVELILPTIAQGMGTIGATYASSRQAPTTSVRQAAEYDNSPEKGYNPQPGERTLDGYVKNNANPEISLHTDSAGFNNNNGVIGGDFKRFGADSHGGVSPHVHQPQVNVAPNGDVYGSVGTKTSNGGVTAPTEKDVKQLYDYLANGKYH